MEGSIKAITINMVGMAHILTRKSCAPSDWNGSFWNHKTNRWENFYRWL